MRQITKDISLKIDGQDLSFRLSKLDAFSGVSLLRLLMRLRRWAKWARSTGKPNRIALGTLTIRDNVSGFKTTCTGVSLQKVPDRTWDRTGTNVTYTLLAATITEQ